MHMYVTEIDAVTFHGSCVIWVVFPCCKGLPPVKSMGAINYIMREKEFTDTLKWA